MYHPKNYVQSEGDDFVWTMHFFLSLTFTVISLVGCPAAECNLPPLLFGSFEPPELNYLLGKTRVDGLDQAVHVVIGSSSTDEIIPCAGKVLQFSATAEREFSV